MKKHNEAVIILAVIGVLAMIGGSIPGGLFFLAIAALIYFLCRKKDQYIEKKKSLDFQKVISSPIFIDTETTGLNPNKNDELLQIAIINMNGDTLFYHLIKPDHRRSWPKATEINGITPAMVKNEDGIDVYLDQLIGIFQKASCVIGYNVDFDLGFIRAAGISYSGPTIDIMKDYADYRAIYDAYHKHNRWFKLSSCASHFGYDWGKDTQHDSLSDVKATLFCFQKLREAGYYGATGSN